MTYTQRRNAARDALKKQWRRCFWQRPIGHTYEQSRCVYCGRPESGDFGSLFRLEDLASRTQSYPIAQGEKKRAIV